MKVLSRTLFVAYLLILLWLVLFKFSYEPWGVIRDYHRRTLNLSLFAYARRSEMLANVLAFIPFGVMLGVNGKRIPAWQKLAAMSAFSVAVELIQYLLAIGATDVTDVLMNTLGGAVGLGAYAVVGRRANERVLDRRIFVAGAVILLAILYFRIFVFIVRY